MEPAKKITKANGHIVQSDWNQTDSSQMDYIHNKPIIPDSSIFATNEDLDKVESIAKGANQAVSFANYQHLTTVLKSHNNPIYRPGQNLYIAIKDVPDLWVYYDYERYDGTFEYTNDEDFLQAMADGYGILRIGCYEVAMLETQKANLIEYQKRLSLPLKAKTDKESDYIGSTTVNGETKKYWQFDWTQKFSDGSDGGPIGRIAFTHWSDRAWVDENNEIIEDPPYGLETNIVLNAQNSKYTVPYRDGTGNFQISQPTLDYHASTKNYVDRLMVQTNGEAFKSLTTGKTYANDNNLITDFESVDGFLTYFNRTGYPLNGGGFVPGGTILRIKLSNDSKYLFVICVVQSASNSTVSFPRGEAEEANLIKAIDEATYNSPLQIGRWKFIKALHPAMKYYTDEIAKELERKINNGGSGDGNVNVIISDTEPENAPAGTLWFDTSETTVTYIEGVKF